jgi:hypothetical protein
MAVLILVYSTNYGPTNFLYFCDMSLIIALIGVWLESPLLVSMPTVGILAPQILWVADFALKFFSVHLTGMTDYTFNTETSLLLRGGRYFTAGCRFCWSISSGGSATTNAPYSRGPRSHGR